MQIEVVLTVKSVFVIRVSALERIFLLCVGRFTNVAQPSPLVSISQNSQQDTQLQRLPGTPNVNASSKQSKDTPSIGEFNYFYFEILLLSWTFSPVPMTQKLPFIQQFFQLLMTIPWNFLIEQVVPNCSPSIINDEKPNIKHERKNNQNALLPPFKEHEDNDRALLSQVKLEKPPDDEKSNIQSKRRNRRMPENSNTKNLEFFEEDEIFA